MRPRWRIWLAASLLLVLAATVTFLSLLSARSRGAQKIVMERWAETVGTPEDVEQRFPATEINGKARALIDHVAPLGLDIAPRYEEDYVRPPRALAQRFKQFKGQSSSWFNTQLRRASGPPDPAPEVVSVFLDEFREDIDRLREELLSPEKPVWATDLSRHFTSPIPNLLGHVDLNIVLLADSLDALSRGDAAHAGRSLEAAWELAQLLDEVPIMISRLVRMNMVRSQVQVVRLAPWLQHWAPRLGAQDLRTSIAEALMYEGWAWPQWKFEPGEDDGVMARMKLAVTGSMMRLGASDASERWRRTMIKLGELPSWCQPTLDRLAVRLDMPMPWWNVYGKMLAFDIEQAVRRVEHVQLQVELTRLVLETAAIRAETGDWPVGSDPWLRSRACPGDTWGYEIDDTRVLFRFDRELLPLGAAVPAAWEFSLDGRTLAAGVPAP